MWAWANEGGQHRGHGALHQHAWVGLQLKPKLVTKSLGLGSNLSPSSRPIWASPKRISITNLGLGSNLHLWASLKGSKLPHSPPLQPDPSFNPTPWRPSYVDGCKILSHGFRCEAATIQTYILKNFNDNNFKY